MWRRLSKKFRFWCFQKNRFVVGFFLKISGYRKIFVYRERIDFVLSTAEKRHRGTLHSKKNFGF